MEKTFPVAMKKGPEIICILACEELNTLIVRWKSLA